MRCDRGGGQVGSGVCVFIKSNLCYNIVKIPIEFAQLEIICLDITINKLKQKFICAYRPPSFDLLCTNNLINCFNVLYDIDYVFTICTSFNLPNFYWNNVFDVSSLCALNASLAKFIEDNGMIQLITESTRQLNTLDLLLVNDPLTVYNVTVTAPFCTSDHCMVLWPTYFPF